MDDNGILARIPGEHIAKAIRSFPLAEGSLLDTVQTELHVPGIGRIQFSAKRLASKKGRSRSYFWSVFRAVQVAE